MAFLFSGATSFNQPLGAWRTGSVTDMGGMFENATSFDQDLSAWETRKVRRMNAMFKNAAAFSHSIQTWNLASLLCDKKQMFVGAVAYQAKFGPHLPAATTSTSSRTPLVNQQQRGLEPRSRDTNSYRSCCG